MNTLKKDQNGVIVVLITPIILAAWIIGYFVAGPALVKELGVGVEKTPQTQTEVVNKVNKVNE